MIKIAITGGIATGKSTFSNMIIHMGYPVIDCDALVHESYQMGGKIYQAILNHFGDVVLSEDRQIDRAKVSKIVFHDKVELEALNQLTHPIVNEMVSERIHQLEERGERLIFIDVPLLFEANLQTYYDASILVDTTDQLQLERLMSRNGFSKEEALLRMSKQMPLSQKRALATYIIVNDGGLTDLEKQTELLVEKLLRLR